MSHIDRVIIHMGFHKTGSTFLQALFAAHSEDLRRKHVHYVPDPDFAAQHRLAWRLVGNDISGLKDLVDAAAKNGCSTLLLSSEDFEGLLRDTDLASRIAGELFRLGVARVEWHVVLRSPGQVFGSLVSEMSRHVFVDPCQFLGEAMQRGAILLDAPSRYLAVPYWFFVFDQSHFVGRFAREVKGVVKVHNFAEPGPYPGWQVAEAVGVTGLDWKSVPDGLRNKRDSLDMVETQFLERFAECLPSGLEEIEDLLSEMKRHLSVVLPCLPQLSQIVEVAFIDSHHQALRLETH